MYRRPLGKPPFIATGSDNLPTELRQCVSASNPPRVTSGCNECAEELVGPYRHWESIAYFAAVAAFSINAATSRGCKRKMAWGPESSTAWD
jgi:hypothetical protein